MYMCGGKQRAARFLIAAQANLVWADESTDVAGFIETGELGGGSDVMPYDPTLREAVVKEFQGRV